jgi:predicted negative regulator of RcsB-dependent stress response
MVLQFGFAAAPASMRFDRTQLTNDDFRLAFWRRARRISHFMQSQETTAADVLFRLMPWFEANRKRLAYGAAFILIAVLIYSFYSYRQNQTEITAGQALTQVLTSGNNSGLADACLKIEAEYPGTLAAQRALLEAATTLFASGKYADAQAQFQKFLATYPDNFFTPQATLGVAASLDAQGKGEPAFSAYQKAAGQSADPSVVAAAKFALGRMDESQGKFADAAKIYADVARAFPNSSTGMEASRRALELKSKSPSAVAPAPAPASNAPFTLSH